MTLVSGGLIMLSGKVTAIYHVFSLRYKLAITILSLTLPLKFSFSPFSREFFFCFLQLSFSTVGLKTWYCSFKRNSVSIPFAVLPASLPIVGEMNSGFDWFTCLATYRHLEQYGLECLWKVGIEHVYGYILQELISQQVLGETLLVTEVGKPSWLEKTFVPNFKHHEYMQNSCAH